MSEYPPNEQPSAEPGTASPCFSVQETELLLEFSDFLSETRPETAVFETEDAPGIGLYQLFEALTAQRHELKLYTKAGRQTQELLQQSIESISNAADLLQRCRKERPEIERKALEPFLSSLMEIDESLQRAGSVLESLQDRLTAVIRNRMESAAKTYCDELSWWSRFRQRKAVLRFAACLSRNGIEEIEQTLEPFRLGFAMLQDRMDDVLKKHSIRRLNPVGEAVDPETMQVVAVVESPSVPPGHVADVVRFGYLHHDKVLRFADVRAVREI